MHAITAHCAVEILMPTPLLFAPCCCCLLIAVLFFKNVLLRLLSHLNKFHFCYRIADAHCIVFPMLTPHLVLLCCYYHLCQWLIISFQYLSPLIGLL